MILQEQCHLTLACSEVDDEVAVVGGAEVRENKVVPVVIGRILLKGGSEGCPVTIPVVFVGCPGSRLRGHGPHRSDLSCENREVQPERSLTVRRDHQSPGRSAERPRTTPMPQLSRQPPAWKAAPPTNDPEAAPRK